MTTAPLLLDTSVAVALSIEDHEGHAASRGAVRGRQLGLAGHAAFEAFSVLTRLPEPNRRTPQAVARLLTRNFPHSRFLDQDATADLLARLPRLGLGGGAVYDALVGNAAAVHRLPLATRDRRALRVYEALGVELLLID